MHLCKGRFQVFQVQLAAPPDLRSDVLLDLVHTSWNGEVALLLNSLENKHQCLKMCATV